MTSPLTVAVFPGINSIVLQFSFDIDVTNEHVVTRHANVRVTLRSSVEYEDTCRFFVFTFPTTSCGYAWCVYPFKA
jgi:hypothetical protein